MRDPVGATPGGVYHGKDATKPPTHAPRITGVCQARGFFIAQTIVADSESGADLGRVRGRHGIDLYYHLDSANEE